MILPPLLTVVILLWIFRTVVYYVLDPVADGTRYVVAWVVADIHESLPNGRPTTDPTVVQLEGRDFKQLPSEQFIPLEVYQTVSRSPGQVMMPAGAWPIYQRYVEIQYLPPPIVYPIVLVLFFVVLYLVGRFFAVGIGRVTWGLVEKIIHRVPLVRNVYSSVKQVTDFMVSDNEYEFNRIVAVEYPRAGMWTIAFVTGEGLLDVQTAAGEQLLAVLIPTNPTPITGYTALVRRSEVIDLNLTIDQACQYIISCGVVVPAHQLFQPELGLPSLAKAKPENAG
ncbi:MAG TPA: DUF502 domain-containing protein [Pirellulales bacterium]|nr:DUF502 domain-containing protein [Pirellulales bacterium]